MTEADFQDYLTEVYGTITIAGLDFEAGYILKKLDPVAFRVFLSDMEAVYEEE